jgi:hypothetical protein
VAERARNAPATTRRTRFDNGGRRRNRRSPSQVPHSNRLASRCLPSQVPCRSTARMAGREGRKEAEASCEWYGNRRAAPLAEFVSATRPRFSSLSPTPSVSRRTRHAAGTVAISG